MCTSATARIAGAPAGDNSGHDFQSLNFALCCRSRLQSRPDRPRRKRNRQATLSLLQRASRGGMASHISSLASGGHSSNALERSLTLTAAAAEQIISETIKHEEDLLPKEVYDDQAYKELAKDEVVDRKLKLSDAPSGRLEELKRQHSMQFDKTMNLNRRQKLWMLLDDPSFSSASFYYANFSMLIILISTISFCLESEFNCQNVDLHTHLLNYTLPNGQLACKEWEGTWWWFECLAVAFFSAELLLRWASCPYKGKFMKDFANWIDFLAVLPFYLEQVCTLSHAHSAHVVHLCTCAPVHLCTPGSPSSASTPSRSLATCSPPSPSSA